MRSLLYSYTCFGAIISPSSGSWHQNSIKTYGNKVGHCKHTYIVISVVQNFNSLVKTMYISIT